MTTSSLWDEREPPSASFDEALDRLLVAVMDEPSEKPPPKARPLWPPRADDTVLDEGLGDEDELESLITVRTRHVPEAPAPIPAEPLAIPAEPGPELSEELELEDDQPTIVLTTHQIMLMRNVSDAPEPAASAPMPPQGPAHGADLTVLQRLAEEEPEPPPMLLISLVLFALGMLVGGVVG